jgi:ELWxxDGT repeat protein
VYQFGTSIPDRAFDYNGTLLFTVDNIYLWKSDGTNAGTISIAGTNGFDNPVNVNGTIYFNVGTQLWKTQGTLATTGVITTLGNIPSDMVNLNGTLYFMNGTGLWKSDGTGAGTILVRNFGAGAYNFKIINNLIFFFGNDGTTGYELWRSDGTNAGTFLVKDINVGTTSGIENLFGAVIPPANNIFYFIANDGTTGSEIWRSDGTNAGTYLVKDIKVGVNSSINYLSPVLGVANSTLLFTADDGTTGYQLFKTDGTNANTTLLKTIAPSISSSFDYSYIIPKITQLDATNLIVIPKDDSDTTALWKTDGTATNTLKIKKIQLDNFYTGDFGRLNNKLYFSGGNFSSTFGNFDLWVTDGTTTGTQLLTNLRPSGSSSPSQFYTFNGLVYMEAWNTATQRSVYRTDGTVAGTIKLLDNYSIGDYVEYNGNLYFKNFKGNLYRTDGSVANTVVVTNLSINTSISGSGELATTNNLIFFAAYGGTGSGVELWKSNGTIAGTSIVKEISIGAGSSNPQSFSVLNNNLYFLAFDGTNYGLWKSDGTNAGTVLVKTLGNKVNVTYNFNLKNVNNVLYFDYNDGINGHELWKSDGTLAGTVLVKDINPNGSSAPRNFTDINGKLYFTANDNINGMELWTSDGTAAGTNMIYDVNVGVAGSFPQSITFFNNYIYFFAFSATKGYELWRIDPNTLETIATNSWSANPTWNTNTPPTATKTAKINATHTVSVPNTGNQVKTIQMNGGSINLNGGTIQINN